MADRENSTPLTDRQLEVLELVAQGATNKEIGRALNISEHTVRKHLENIFEKLEVSSRTEATTRAYQEGWVSLSSPETAALAADVTVQDASKPQGLPVDPRLLAISGLALVGLVVVLTWLVINGWQTALPNSGDGSAADADRWKEETALPVPRTGLAVVAYGGHIYVLAGETKDGPTGLTGRFDPRNERWESLAGKPTAVRDVNAVVLAGRIYVPGGCLEDGSPTAVLEIYDPEADAWKMGTPMPQGLCAYAMAALEGSLYIFGGWDGTGYVRSVLSYDPEQDRWDMRTPMLTARGYAGAAAIEDQIYVVGGYDGRRDLAAVEVYTPSKEKGGENPWTTVDPLPEGRGGAGVVTLRSWLYVIGGGWEAGRPTAMRYDARTQTWTPFANPTVRLWRNMGVAAVDTPEGTRIYAIGGWDGDYVAANRAYIALYNVMVPFQR